MFEKFFSSIGFEGVEVKTIIEPNTFSRGDTIKGTVFIAGGKSEQEIQGIKLTLMVTHLNEVREDSDFSYYDEEVKQVVLKDTKQINKDEKIELPFELPITKDHPVSSKTIESFVKTKLLVHNGVDPEDKDIVIIK